MRAALYVEPERGGKKHSGRERRRAVGVIVSESEVNHIRIQWAS